MLRLTLPVCRCRGIGRVLVMVLGVALGVAGAESVAVLSAGDISSWDEKSFRGRTVYETVTLDGRSAVRASSNGTASALFRRIRIDLQATPFLRWSWRVEKTLDGVDERTRAGDDYSARVYVIRRNPVWFWMTRALNYVWSSSLSEGMVWPNAHTAAVQMVAVRSGTRDTGRWVDERRDVRADFLRIMGRRVRYIDGVAVMSDTDSSGGTTVAYYGDIHFSSE